MHSGHRGLTSLLLCSSRDTALPLQDRHARTDFYPLTDPAVEYPVDRLVSLIGRLGVGTEASDTAAEASNSAAAELGKLGKLGALAAVQLAKCAAADSESGYETRRASCPPPRRP